MRRMLAAALAAVAVAGCGGGGDDSPREVEYRVNTGIDGFFRDRASVTYSSSSGATAQANVLLPWTFTRTARPGDFLYISAQNLQSSGQISVSIYVDGARLKGASSNGGFAIATASSTCCESD